MRSIKEIFVIGHGPSSSHTMAPAKAAEYILDKYKKEKIKEIEVTLYGSLAATGKGHLTDYILDLKLKKVKHNIIFDNKAKVNHPNTMLFIIKTAKKEYKEKIISIGGGTIVTEDTGGPVKPDTYPQNFMSDILRYCKDNKLSLVDYVKKFEDKDIIDYMDKVYQVMQSAFDRGIRTKGALPGPIKLKRKAPSMFSHLLKEEEESKSDWKNYELIMFIASFAIAEENASGGEIVTAPTCGSAGVLPGCMAYLEARGNDRKTILDSMLVAGLIGILCKTNGSVSGAEAGCQAEIGVACAMGAALIANAKGFNNEMIVQAAEIALEHSLGLTCDPILGYVQVPCIERCAVFALKAKNAVMLTKLLVDETPTISFDDSVKTMYETGKDLQEGYRETSLKGLASLMKHKS